MPMGTRADDLQMHGAGGGSRECEPWDRCWCVLELAIRYFAALRVICMLYMYKHVIC